MPEITFPEAQYIASDMEHLEKKIVLNEYGVKQKQIFCNLCGYFTVRPFRMRQHIQIKHSGSEGLQTLHCSLCVFSTNNKSSLSEHMNIQHAGADALYTCTKCDYRTPYKANLQRHMLTHAKQKIVKCPKCPFESRLSKMPRHMKKHDKQAYNKCPYCNYSAIRMSLLKDHINIHLGRNKYFCHICRFSTYFRQHFKKHYSQFHGGVMPRELAGSFNIESVNDLQTQSISQELIPTYM